MEPVSQVQQQIIYDQKWELLRKRAWLFHYIPFIDFVLGSGSMAIGNVDRESDLDVLIAVKQGRIFTTRFITAVIFGLFGWRRKKSDTHDRAANKVCLNHFITPRAYKFSLQPNAYWRLMYERMVPLYGKASVMQGFFDVNRSWIGKRVEVGQDLRHRYQSRVWLASFFQWVLSGRFGDVVERFLKQLQTKRIASGRKEAQGEKHVIRISGVGERARIELSPLIRVSDDELEFHPDPAVIEFS
jgi:hypothetical protein